MTVLFICMFYSSTMPLLYPLTLLFLTVMYVYSKFMLLKFCQKTQIFNENLVIDSFKPLSVAILMHFIMAIQMIGNSKMLANQSLSNGNFDNRVMSVNELSLTDAQTAILGMPSYMKLYISFVVISIILYFVNLLIVNPFTIWFKIGLCVKKQAESRKRSTAIKNARIKKHL